jgi:ubiquitin carboxyl-terminal hydrolase 4/11/15
MIIHLKRFQFTQHFRRKLRNTVVFPVEGLDLSRIIATADQCSGNSDRAVALNLSGKIVDHDEIKDVSIPENATCRSNPGVGRSPETLYDLYAVVHHLGALSGGHYVASVCSEKDGKWRIFNDAQVTEVCSKDIVDASAYILFYLRRDMKNVALEDVWDTTSRTGEGVTEDQIDKLVKQRSERCIVS